MKKLVASLMLALALLGCKETVALGATNLDQLHTYDFSFYLEDVMVLSPTSTSAFINGQTVVGNQPLLIDNRTMVPVRFVAEAMQIGTVEWNPSLQQIRIVTQDDQEIKMFIGQNTIFLDHGTYQMDVVPQVVENRTYIPLRALGDILGKFTYYDEPTQLIVIRNADVAEPLEYHSSIMAYLQWAMQDHEIVYSDSLVTFIRKEGKLYQILETFDENGYAIEEQPFDIANNSFLWQTQKVGENWYFSYHPALASANYAAVYEQNAKGEIAFIADTYASNWQVYHDYFYVLDNMPYEISPESDTAYAGNLQRISLIDAKKGQPGNPSTGWEKLGKEGYLYGYPVRLHKNTNDTYTVVGRISDTAPQLITQEDGIYSFGVELYAANALPTLGYYKIDLSGIRNHEKIRDCNPDEFMIENE